MNKPPHAAPIARTTHARDHLLLMAQLAGTAGMKGENDVIHFVRRSLIGPLTGYLRFQIAGLVDAVAPSEICARRGQRH